MKKWILLVICLVMGLINVPCWPEPINVGASVWCWALAFVHVIFVIRGK